jgi:16S rRNA (cytidine1402-2'-O)-methyltransferase
VPLWIVATPIGTLDDLSPRAREVLGRAAVIAAEDTRRTRKLLGALDIPAPELVALHAHNEARRAPALVERAGEADVALVSDAGTPGVSDPGGRLVEAALAAGIEIRSVPGPSALAAALAASGFPAAPATFLGFAPRKGRRGFVEDAVRRPETLLVYEAPSRAADLVARLARAAPHREGVLCRELSKRFETVLRAPLPELAATLADQAPRGECVVLVGPGEAAVATPAPPVGEGVKEAAAALAARWEVPRRDVYQGLLALERELRGADGA